MARLDVPCGAPLAANFTGAGTNYVIETSGGSIYVVFVDSASQDVYYKKSTDGGLNFAPAVLFSSALSVTNLSVWFDEWSGLSSGLIHAAYTDSAADDTFYRTLDTSTDTLSTQTTVFLGASTANGGHISITRSQGGNVYIKTVIDAGAEGGFFRLLNADVPNGAWASRAVDETIATTDQMILLPGFAADNNDILAGFWDASANEISRKIYDDSANTWSETSISASMTDVAATTSFPHFAAAVDLANSLIYLAAWTAVDTLNADLKCYSFDETTINTLTDVVLNSTDDQGLAALSLNTSTGDLYAYYVGKSDGSETVGTSVNVYMKVSEDGGTTWGSETLLSNHARNIGALFAAPQFSVNAHGCYFQAVDGGTTGYQGYYNVEAPASGGGLAANPIRGFIG